MKITQVSSSPVSIPASHTKGLRTALGRRKYFDYAVVEIKTDEGLTGIGEISSIWGSQAHLMSKFLVHDSANALKGCDPLSVTSCMNKIRTRFDRFEPAYAAIEMALLDIAGKALGTPVYNLIGGRVRDSVVLSRSIGMGNPADMAAAAASAVADGFVCVKVKIGVDLQRDLEGVAAIRAAIGPGVTLRLDANMGWLTAKEAIRNIRLFEEFKLHSVEQPIPPGNPEALQDIRRAVETPIMVDESLWSPRDAWTIVRAGRADMLNVYVAEAGGIRPAQLIFQLGRLAGADCLIGAMPEFGIGTAAAVHLAVAVEELRHPCDACGVIYHDVDLVNEEFRIEDGRIWPPDGAGLGVTLDRDALERFRAREPTKVDRHDPAITQDQRK